MAINYDWPPNGATGWGTEVDTNLESMEARLNDIEAAIASLQSSNGNQTGTQGPPGPLSLRFYINGQWQPRPVGTENTPILSVSIGQSNVPTPPNPVEGDVWLY